MKGLFFLITGLLVLGVACDNDVPPIENEEELINKITLTFSSANGSSSFTWHDPDGEGPGSATKDTVRLSPEVDYELNISFENTINAIDLTEEIRTEGAEHMIFFGFTTGLFTNPTSTGNISDQGVVNYIDQDINDLPIGLKTNWETGTGGEGSFRLLLKHQPGIKSTSTTSGDGATDADVSFTIVVE